MQHTFVRLRRDMQEEKISRFDIRLGDILLIRGKRVRITLRDMTCRDVSRILKQGRVAELIGRSNTGSWYSFVIVNRALVARPVVRPYGSPFGAVSSAEGDYLLPDMSQEVSVIDYEHLDQPARP